MNQDLAGSKRVLITGGAGFIGSHLVDRLALEAAAREQASGAARLHTGRSG